ncbi:MAG TPA: ABC transporter permease subunit [Trueperaceae bacterium]|nr:ABC transporter permease subunit [Trueperaceae bacterium]
MRIIKNLKHILLMLVVLFSPLALAQAEMLHIPYGWLKFLIAFITLAFSLGLVAYLYGKATRPQKALAYAFSMATHIFIWVIILLTLYPVVYLLAISLSKNDSITAALPKTGNIIFRSGVLPDPAKFSFIQYQKVLGQTHLLNYQWLLLGVFLFSIAVIVFVSMAKRLKSTNRSFEQYKSYATWLSFISLAVLVISINPSQFYFINEAGQRVGSSSERKIILYIRNTLVVSGVTGIFAVLISTTAGYAFSRMRFQGRYQTLLSFVFIQMFPGFMALVAIFYMMNYLDLLNTYTGLILAYSGGAISFAAWIFKGYLDSISPSLEEAARVDGATHWGAFWRIILPVSIPMLLFIFLLQFIGTYSEFILANILLTGENQWTVGIGLRNFTTNRFNTQWGALAASAVLGSIPILIIFYSFQEALTGQHTAGGVKG